MKAVARTFVFMLTVASAVLLAAQNKDSAAYLAWVKALPVPVVEGMAVDTIETPVKPWPEVGGQGAYFHLGNNVWLDAMVYEIPKGGRLKPQRMFYEQVVYGLVGHGYTIIQQEGRRPEKIEWKENTMFSPPLNVTYEHFNTDPAKPARLLVFSTLPFMAHVAGNTGFLSKVNAPVRERYNAEEDFLRKNERVGNRLVKMNLIPDVRTASLDAWEERGKGNASMFWNMSDNRLMMPHVSKMPVDTYKKGHRHKNEALLYIVSGEGYSLVWKEKGDKPVKLPWHTGSLIVAPYYYFHQHFNTGREPATYLAITPYSLLQVLAHVEPKADEEGGGVGDQIEYENEDPQIRIDYEKATGRKAILK